MDYEGMKEDFLAGCRQRHAQNRARKLAESVVVTGVDDSDYVTTDSDSKFYEYLSDKLVDVHIVESYDPKCEPELPLEKVIKIKQEPGEYVEKDEDLLTDHDALFASEVRRSIIFVMYICTCTNVLISGLRTCDVVYVMQIHKNLF